MMVPSTGCLFSYKSTCAPFCLALGCFTSQTPFCDSSHWVCSVLWFFFFPCSVGDHSVQTFCSCGPTQELLLWILDISPQFHQLGTGRERNWSWNSWRQSKDIQCKPYRDFIVKLPTFVPLTKQHIPTNETNMDLLKKYFTFPCNSMSFC